MRFILPATNHRWIILIDGCHIKYIDSSLKMLLTPNVDLNFIQKCLDTELWLEVSKDDAARYCKKSIGNNLDTLIRDLNVARIRKTVI